MITLKMQIQQLKEENKKLNHKQKKSIIAPLPYDQHTATMVAATAKMALSHHVKFIANQEMLDDLKTVGRFILGKHNVEKDQARW